MTTKTKIYSTDAKIKTKRRRIGEFNDKIRRFKQSLSIEDRMRHEIRLIENYGLKLTN